MKNILFRADSSSTIGTGHIMRDLVLASQYKDATIFFATLNLDGNINHKIMEARYKLEILQSNNIDELHILIDKLKIDLLVIDHYKIDETFEKLLKVKNPNLKILSFDDTYEKHYCDILLNHNISANKKRYKDLVPKDCELRCGSKYTLLRDEFYKEKKKFKKKNRLQYQNLKFKIFLAMGGSDSLNLNPKILKVLKKIGNIEVNLVTTIANENLNQLKEYCKDKKWINLYINSNKIAKLMRKSDFAIVTPSVTLNEVYFMELPFIAIKTAENQNGMYRFVKKDNKMVLKFFDKDKLREKVFYMQGSLQ